MLRLFVLVYCGVGVIVGVIVVVVVVDVIGYVAIVFVVDTVDAWTLFVILLMLLSMLRLLMTVLLLVRMLVFSLSMPFVSSLFLLLSLVLLLFCGDVVHGYVGAGADVVIVYVVVGVVGGVDAHIVVVDVVVLHSCNK